MGFYKSFGRPIAKVFLGSVVTYQTVYWLWVKLDTDDAKDKKRSERAQVIIVYMVPLAKNMFEGEILRLEAEIQEARKKSSE